MKSSRVVVVVGLVFFFFAACIASAGGSVTRRPLPREIEELPFKDALDSYWQFLQNGLPKDSPASLRNFGDFQCEGKCLDLLQFLEEPVKQFMAVRETSQEERRKKVSSVNVKSETTTTTSESFVKVNRELTLTNLSAAPEAEYWDGPAFHGYMTPLLTRENVLTKTIVNTTVVITQNTTYNETSGEYQTVNVTTYINGPSRQENYSDTAVPLNVEDNSFLSSQVKPDPYVQVKAIIYIMDLALPIVFLSCEAPPYPINMIGCVAWTIARAIQVASVSILDAFDGWNGNTRGGWVGAIQQYAEILNEATACTPANRTDLPFQGCNGVDDNCNLQIDECKEDTTPPTVKVDQAALNANGFYASEEAAYAAIMATVYAVDDCNRVEFSSPAVRGSCGFTVATAVATDSCGNSAVVKFSIGLDVNAPSVTCSVSNSLFQSTGSLVDVGYSVTASDDCALAKVEVTVMMDEPTTGASTDAMVQTDFLTGEVTGVLIKAEANPNLNGRVYTIYATATDKAGNEATCSTEVEVVISSDATSAVDDGPFYKPKM